MFLLIFKDILQIAFCQELLFQIMIALRLLTIVFLFSFRAKISWNVLLGTHPNPKRWMKSISIRKPTRWSKPLTRPINWSKMKFWLCQKNNPHKPEKTSTHERAISRVWRFSFLFCHRHSAQNLRIKFYTKNLQKSGFWGHFAVPLRILLQICYKLATNDWKGDIKISNHSLTSWTFEHHPR